MISLSIELDKDMIEEARKRLGADELAHRKHAAMTESLAYLQQQVQERVPVNTGITRAGIFTTIRGSPLEMRGIVASPHEHMPVLEFGRKPGGRMPPVDVIERWAYLKLGQAGLGFVIARSIAMKGTKALKIFTTVAQVGREAVVRIWYRHLSRM